MHYEVDMEFALERKARGESVNLESFVGSRAMSVHQLGDDIFYTPKEYDDILPRKVYTESFLERQVVEVDKKKQ